MLGAQVRGATAESKRAFLAEKGLTPAEMDEAFRRIPDSPAASVAAAPGTGLPVAPAAQLPQKPFPTGSAVGSTLEQLQAAQPPPPPQPIRWTQVIICVLCMHPFIESIRPKQGHCNGSGACMCGLGDYQ